MILTTLGGSAAGPNPGQGCSGYLVESDRTRIVLDLGPGTLPELRRHVDYRSLDAVVLSHLNLVHMLDVLALRYALTYNPIPPRTPVPLWVPPGGRAFLQGIARAVSDSEEAPDYFDALEIREYDPGAALVIGNVKILFHSTFHYVPCWAMRLSNFADGDLFYSADTGPKARLMPFARGSRVVIAEGTAANGGVEPQELRGHLTPAEAGRLARDVGADTLVLSHVWAEDNQFLALEEARAEFQGPVILATPGMRLAWSPRN
jgi:ribonuclease BN (tRNA processing enzyme)